MPDEVFVIRKNDGLTAPCDCNYIASSFPLEDDKKYTALQQPLWCTPLSI